MEKKTPTEKTAWRKPEIKTEKLNDAFLQSGCVKCQVVVGPEVGCFKPDQS